MMFSKRRSSLMKIDALSDTVWRCGGVMVEVEGDEEVATALQMQKKAPYNMYRGKG